MKPELFTFKFSQMPMSDQTSIFNNIKICSKQKFINNKKNLNQVNKISLKSCLNSENLFDLNFISSKNKFRPNMFSCDSNSQTSSNQTKRSSVCSDYQNIKDNRIKLKQNIQRAKKIAKDQKRSEKDDKNFQNIQKMNQKIRIIQQLIQKQNQNILRMGQNNNKIKNQINLQEITSNQKQNVIYNLKSQSMNSKRAQNESFQKRLSADSKNLQKDSFLKEINNQKKYKYYHPKNKNAVINNFINKQPKFKYLKQNKQIKRKELSHIENVNKNIIICIEDLKTNDEKSEKSHHAKVSKKDLKGVQLKNSNKLQQNQSQTLVEKLRDQCQLNQLRRRSSWIQAAQKSALSSTTYSQNNSKLNTKNSSSKKNKMLSVFEKTQNLLGQYKDKCVSLQKQKEKIEFKYNQIVQKLNQITENFNIPKINLNLKQQKKDKALKQNRKNLPKTKVKNK